MCHLHAIVSPWNSTGRQVLERGLYVDWTFYLHNYLHMDQWRTRDWRDRQSKQIERKVMAYRMDKGGKGIDWRLREGHARKASKCEKYTLYMEKPWEKKLNWLKPNHKKLTCHAKGFGLYSLGNGKSFKEVKSQGLCFKNIILALWKLAPWRGGSGG